MTQIKNFSSASLHFGVAPTTKYSSLPQTTNLESNSPHNNRKAFQSYQKNYDIFFQFFTAVSMYFSIVSIVSQYVVNFNEFNLYSIAFWLYYTHFVTSTAFSCTLETKVTVFSYDIIYLLGFLPFLDNIVFVYVYQNFGKKILEI